MGKLCVDSLSPTQSMLLNNKEKLSMLWSITSGIWLLSFHKKRGNLVKGTYFSYTCELVPHPFLLLSVVHISFFLLSLNLLLRFLLEVVEERCSHWKEVKKVLQTSNFGFTYMLGTEEWPFNRECIGRGCDSAHTWKQVPFNRWELLLSKTVFYEAVGIIELHFRGAQRTN